MSFFTILLLILISLDCQAQAECLHMALHCINGKGWDEKGNKTSEMGPQMSMYMNQPVWVDKGRKKAPSPLWMTAGVTSHRAMNTNTPKALTGAPQYSEALQKWEKAIEISGSKVPHCVESRT